MTRIPKRIKRIKNINRLGTGSMKIPEKSAILIRIKYSNMELKTSHKKVLA
jgi:hypothetical protein